MPRTPTSGRTTGAANVGRAIAKMVDARTTPPRGRLGINPDIYADPMETIVQKYGIVVPVSEAVFRDRVDLDSWMKRWANATPEQRSQWEREATEKRQAYREAHRIELPDADSGVSAATSVGHRSTSATSPSRTASATGTARARGTTAGTPATRASHADLPVSYRRATRSHVYLSGVQLNHREETTWRVSSTCASRPPRRSTR
jgi:hypothetical protein